MSTQVILHERIFNAPIVKVWNAISDVSEMRNWYFDIEEMRLETGAKFKFIAGENEDKLYQHNCEITDVKTLYKLSYNWCYDGHPGVSNVTFELSEIENKTLLKFKHIGIDNFPKDNPDFAFDNFVEGWYYIIHIALKNYLEKSDKSTITVETTISAPLQKVWQYWNEPEHITQWYFASNTWHAPFATNDLRVGGKFKITMAAKDMSYSFDFEGIYSHIIHYQLIEYIINDGRSVKIIFASEANKTHVSETFEAEDANPLEEQKSGWQSILDNFKIHVESN
jgi:uncharacterized protein YndB with AHSA1/START domain